MTVRRPQGTVSKRKRNGKLVWVARFYYTDEHHKQRERLRVAHTKWEADAKLHELRNEYRAKGKVEVDRKHATFDDVSKRYEASRVHPAEFHKGKKTSGLKSHYQVKLYLNILREHFGHRRIRELRHSDFVAFKRLRLKTPTKGERERAIASVNRELETLRAVLRFAVREGFIEKSPFDQGEPLIVKQHETRRERVLTLEEESRLLDACNDRYHYLKPLIITALDTGMRRGELFALVWSDVDFTRNLIGIRPENEKANRGRSVAMTVRAREALIRLWEASDKRNDETVFGISDNIKRSWGSVCSIAKIRNLRFHDLRHTFVTRAIRSGVPVAEALKAGGWSTLSMLSRYLNPGDESALATAKALDVFLQQGTQDDVSERAN